MAKKNKGIAAKSKNYFRSCYEELKKVNWPSKDEVLNMSQIVIVFIIIAAIFLGVTDVVSFKFVSWVFGL